MAFKPSILIAEDDELVLTLFQRLLCSRGWQVKAVTNGYDALREWKNHNGYDLTILDVRMPKMDGYTAYQQMRKIKPDSRFVFVSGYSNETVEFQVHEVDGVPYLQKPFDSMEFLRVVSEIVAEIELAACTNPTLAD